MLKILRDRFISLGRDEDGAALVITLAVFMFIYVLFIGIWAVGTNVRTRIHLQNACDAAAYSAAVVQADTLSRIATINRAMSWTYVQMTRRQMDWVVYKWLGEVIRHWDEDNNHARSHGSFQTAECSNLKHHLSDWHCDTTLSLQKASGTAYANINELKSRRTTFGGRNWTGDSSFYASSSFTGQIQNDREAILSMRREIDLLEQGFSNRAVRIVHAIVGSNLKGLSVELKGSPQVVISDLSDSLEDLSNADWIGTRERQEARFTQFIQESLDTAFGNSGTVWFTRESDSPFRRHYRGVGNVLSASWTWHSTKWCCTPATEGSPEFHIPICATCNHGNHDTQKCRCGAYSSRFGRVDYRARVYADNNLSRDGYYSTAQGYAARPRVLKSDYFGKTGTITVGFVVGNANPWSWVGDVSRGIFSAFDPFVKKTFCVASAKAGYRNFADGRRQFGRDYRIDWGADEATWNLYTSDWDAVMVPVPRAASFAANRSWGAMVDAISGLASSLDLNASDFRAGGSKAYRLNFTRDGSAYNWDQYLDLSGDDYAQGTAVQAKWQIENNGRPVKSWVDLQKRMWH